MKPGQYFCLIAGSFFLLLGIAGLIPGLVESADVASKTSEAYGMAYGYIAGVIPTNGNHAFIRIVVGLLGIVASISLDSSRIYSRLVAVSYGLFAVLGLIPYTNTLFGTVPIFGSDVLLHAASAAIAFYYGFLESPGLLELSSTPKQEPQ
ncbi:DUF4383 domain-containing protein [Phormidium sp. CLA17]|uniref:DUF4383 domain-containing protein n=1 Tax=Leptolyngbya sp. Cla-17 TaxID=2803751 RepID=UPI00149220C6|nr:DUF4383 domain-containing protein [Leptolyngbya sp. Cla-17]MBM0740276.1 DUF4383 domain-containing protein [Leptolyngbya sp. Cla-17]